MPRTAALFVFCMSTSLWGADAYVDVWNWTSYGLTDSRGMEVDVNPDRSLFYTTQFRGDVMKHRVCAGYPRITPFTCTDLPGTWNRSTFAFDVHHPARAYVTASNRLWRSLDRGQNWTPILTLNFRGAVIERALVSKVDGTIFAFSSSSLAPAQVWISTDDGVTFQPQLMRNELNLVCWAALEDRKSGTLYAGFENLTHPEPYNPPFLRSKDRGLTWQKMHLPFPWHVVGLDAAEMMPDGQTFPDRQVIYALQEGHSLLRSSDGGDSWQDTSPYWFFSNILVNPNHPGMLHILPGLNTSEGLSTNFGVSWTYQATPNQRSLPIAVDAGTDRLFVVDYSWITSTQYEYAPSAIRVGLPSATAPTVTGGDVRKTFPGSSQYQIPCRGCSLFTGTAKLTQNGTTVIAFASSAQLLFTTNISGAATLTVGNISVPVNLIP